MTFGDSMRAPNVGVYVCGPVCHLQDAELASRLCLCFELLSNEIDWADGAHPLHVFLQIRK